MVSILAEAGVRLTAVGDDLRRELRRELNEGLREATVDTQPLQDLERQIRRTNLELIRSREAATSATTKVQEAEEDLVTVRKNSESTAADIRAAEDRLTRARAEQEVATDRVSAATERLNRETARRSTILAPATEDERRNTVAVQAGSRATIDLNRGLAGLPSPFRLAGRASTLFGTSLKVMSVASVVGLGALGALAGSGGLAAVAAGAFQAAGAVALLPAALGLAAAAIAPLVVGLQGVGTALGAMDDPEKFAEALKELAPAARSFVVAVRDLAPAARDLRLAVQQRLFAGLADDVETLGERYLPIVTVGLSAVANELNRGAQGFFAFTRQARTVSDTVVFFRNARDATRELSGATVPLLEAFRDIALVGSEFFPGFADAIGEAAVSFRDFIGEARRTGELKEFIADSVSALGDLLGILRNVGGIFAAVFRAGEDAGAGFLASLRSITGEVEDFLDSATGQDALGSFFESAKEAGKALGPVVRELFLLFTNDLAPILADIGVAVGPAVVVVLESLGEALRAAQPGIQAAATGFAAFMRGVAPALPVLGELVNVLGVALGEAFTELGPIIGELVGVLAGELAEVLPELVPALVEVARAAAGLLIAVSPLLPPLGRLATVVLRAFADVATELTPIIADLAADLGGVLAPLIPELAESFAEFADGIAPIAGPLGKALLDVLRAVLPVLPDLIGLMADLLKPLQLVAIALSGLITLGAGFVKFLDLSIGALGDFVDGVGKAASEFGEFVFNGFEAPVKRFEGSLAASMERNRFVVGEATGGIGSSLEILGGTFTRTSGVIGGALGRQDIAAAAWFANLTSNFKGAERQSRLSINGIIATLTGGRNAAGPLGSATGTRYAQGLAVGNAAARVRAATLVASVRSVLGRGPVDAARAGAATANAFAAGVDSPAARVRAAAAAARLIAAVSAYFPSSPAQKGPFSGTGWTPYRGAALIRGFADGMLGEVRALNRVAELSMRGVASGLTGATAWPLRLESVTTRTQSLDSSGYPTAAALEAAVERGMSRMQVVVSGREVASKVTRVHADNRGR